MRWARAATFFSVVFRRVARSAMFDMVRLGKFGFIFGGRLGTISRSSIVCSRDKVTSPGRERPGFSLRAANGTAKETSWFAACSVA